MEICQMQVPSANGTHDLEGVVYLPEQEPIGLFHVVHGMTEYIGRYDGFMQEMAKKGYLCFGYDHIGHGKTAKNPEDLGFFAKDGGYKLLLKDVANFYSAVRAKYDPESRLPYILMGHSMGSFIVRLAAEEYVHPTKLIVMGTGGKNPAASLGIGLASLIQKFYGEKHISPLLESLSFGGFNKKFSDGTEESPNPWLTKDLEIRKKYHKDPLCTFHFTVSALRDLIRLMKYANRKDWFRNIPKELPILLVSGEDDPVGNYGKGVLWVESQLKQNGRNVRAILYPQGRHEILNDSTRNDVIRDILAFVQ